jgi:hypothetical protein
MINVGLLLGSAIVGACITFLVMDYYFFLVRKSKISKDIMRKYLNKEGTFVIYFLPDPPKINLLAPAKKAKLSVILGGKKNEQ